MSRSLSPGTDFTNSSSLLCSLWEKTLKINSRRIVLIEADSKNKWTAQALSDEAYGFLDSLRSFAKGTRIAFCLPNGAQWIAFFLALQKLGLVAIPLDAGLPDPACLEMALRLRCRALFLRGKMQVLDQVFKERMPACCIKVTSGTSGGIPKHVLCLAEHLIADGSNIIRTMGIHRDDRNLAVIPLGHSYGLGNLVLPLILQGTTLVCAGRFVPHQLIEWIGLYRVTIFPSVPAIFRVLASMPGKSRLSPLRLAISAGAPLTADVARAFFQRYHLKIHNFYGSSETGGICYDRRGDATLSGRSVGKPLAGVTMAVSRSRISVESAAVAKRNGRWLMPDRGEWNDKGELVLLGRSGREANIGGKKVHPREVEQAMRTIPGVSDAIVWTATNLGRAFLQAAVETNLPRGSVQRELATRLPEWKLPKQYLIMPEFPRTGRGKANFVTLHRQMDEQLRSPAGA